MSDHKTEILGGDRFGFGDNWANFLTVLNEERIAEAKSSLQHMLKVYSLEGKTFLDIGSGSGLFSLAARLLGASVYSFDYDPQSVACTQEMKRRYFANDSNWIIETGSVLDKDYLEQLGRYDVVYSWGVLHHTGKMWNALENVTNLVQPGGKLFIAIYNHQPLTTKYWITVKRIYNKLPSVFKFFLNYFYFGFYVVALFISDIFRRRNPTLRYSGINGRGMTLFYDIVDWIGGWPFEVASPEEIFRFYRDRNFTMIELVTCGGKHGCNEFVFKADNKRR
jgi:SAM-dependent methyltransferase